MAKSRSLRYDGAYAPPPVEMTGSRNKRQIPADLVDAQAGVPVK
ncbi:MAG TPA: hypothetical protein VHX11_06765 [Acidobacteriaceae bacterium]|nr:hypothetical protein [Acidobacteriaceae bacterium]